MARQRLLRVASLRRHPRSHLGHAMEWRPYPETWFIVRRNALAAALCPDRYRRQSTQRRSVGRNHRRRYHTLQCRLRHSRDATSDREKHLYRHASVGRRQASVDDDNRQPATIRHKRHANIHPPIQHYSAKRKSAQPPHTEQQRPPACCRQDSGSIRAGTAINTVV